MSRRHHENITSSAPPPGGLPITLRESLLRNLLPVVDVLPSQYLVGLVAMVMSPEGKRRGDIVAGTGRSRRASTATACSRYCTRSASADRVLGVAATVSRLRFLGSVSIAAALGLGAACAGLVPPSEPHPPGCPSGEASLDPVSAPVVRVDAKHPLAASRRGPTASCA